ncbi:MAG: ferrochelatase [Acidobacteria bacterium]|nr:ferrochelatase [Acidobacteriota bacterium]
MPQNSSDSLRGVLLLAHGGPDSLDDIEPFLSNIRGGRPTPPKLLEEVWERYRLIGGKSPLLEISRRQAQALETHLNLDGSRYRVYLGMRNWRPFIRDTMEEIQRDRIRQLLAFCLAPQNSAKSVGLYFQHVRDAEQKIGCEIPTGFIESWHCEPLLIEAFVEKLQEGLADFPDAATEPPAVLFTAHSMPERILEEGDPYDSEVHQTAAAVASHCNISDWRFAYQSQGATSETWLGPTVESLLDDLARSGSRRVLLAPIGFVADHVEILYDIDIAFQRFATQRGILLRRTVSLNDSPTFIRALAALVERYFKASDISQGDSGHP